jgi:hypothetical protein
MNDKNIDISDKMKFIKLTLSRLNAKTASNARDYDELS